MRQWLSSEFAHVQSRESALLTANIAVNPSKFILTVQITSEANHEFLKIKKIY